MRSDIVAADQFDKDHPELYQKYRDIFEHPEETWRLKMQNIKPQLPDNLDILKLLIVKWDKRISESHILPRYF